MEKSNQITSSKSTSIAQRIFFRLLSKIKFGKITVNDALGSRIFSGQTGIENYSVSINVKNMTFYKDILVNGSLSAADAYMDGDWETDNLTKLMEIVIRNAKIFYGLDNATAKIRNFIGNFKAIWQKNDIKHAKANIISHYDLGNEFFKLFLDPTMMYSCALYEPQNISQETASLNKLETICRGLELKPTDHLLEIGTGWGGLAIYAARKYGCQVTTVTISDKQFAHVKKEIERLGLQNRVTLLNKDYRYLSGQYDKLVSIEMIEAVGHQYFETFFKCCNDLLKPGGLFFLQAITINDQAYEQSKYQMDFIKKYIFPGGCLPSVSTIMHAVAKRTTLQLITFRDIGEHYAVTLNDWMKKFNRNIDYVRQQGFSEHFIRMWRYYFCYCEAGFKQKYISDAQILWRKR